MSSKNPGCLAVIFGIKSKTIKKSRAVDVPFPAASVGNANLQTVADKSKAALHPIYSSKGILLTNAEVSFFHLLQTMTKDHLVIFPHVALRDLVKVIDQSDYYTHYNRIDRKQVDFVLCDPRSLKPVFVIELDDKSHRRPDRMERDSFVECVLASAKIPLVRVPVKHSYSPRELGILFKSAIEQYVIQKNEIHIQRFSIDNPPFSSRHNVRMILRTARQTREKFWGCPNFPDCREIIKLQDSPN